MAVEEDVASLIEIVRRQQVMLYALHEYLSELTFFDAKRFGVLFEEFDADLIAALKRRPTTSADVALLKRLAKLAGPKH